MSKPVFGRIVIAIRKPKVTLPKGHSKTIKVATDKQLKDEAIRISKIDPLD